ncbi:MAG: cobalt ECF transporter T component CbiQ [Firmicutes bacterium]|nr:cobalt ECF transporter T component CbiQ [Bacillota bacterium]
MLPIDRYAYKNGLSTSHPAEKFAFSMVTLIICLSASDMITSLTVILTMAGVVVIRAGIPMGFYLKLMIVPMTFLVIGVITVAVSVGGTEAYFLYSFTVGAFTLGVTAGSLILAGNLFVKSLSAVSCLYFLSLTTPMVEIIMVLKRLRVPTVIIELMSLIYRFIFVLMDTAGQMYTAQSSRLGYSSLSRGYSSISQLVTNLFVKAYRQADNLSVTLMSRCYKGDLSVLEPEYTVSKRNIMFIGVTDIAFIILSQLHGGNLF